jgi:hypothetical protein
MLTFHLFLGALFFVLEPSLKSLHSNSIGRDMGEVTLKSVPRRRTQWSMNLCNTRDQGAKLFIRRKFLTSACKV